MISATAETAGGATPPPRKSIHLRLGLWIAVALVFAAQVALVFSLGNSTTPAPAKLPPAPEIQLSVQGAEELLALQDQTLFVLPHRDNFSGDAWLKITPQQFAPTNWTEPPRPLPLAPEQLGAAFAAYMQTNPPPRFQPEIESSSLNNPEPAPPREPISPASTFRVAGDLARLRLLTHLRLPSKTNVDLLTNTVVQLLVDARGYPFSPVILSGSGDPDVDAEALTNYARAVRFEPLQQAALGTIPPDKITVGKLIFEWQTLPPAPTNAAPSTP